MHPIDQIPLGTPLASGVWAESHLGMLLLIAASLLPLFGMAVWDLVRANLPRHGRCTVPTRTAHPGPTGRAVHVVRIVDFEHRARTQDAHRPHRPHRRVGARGGS